MKKMRLWYTCRDQNRVESVFSAHYVYTCTCQFDTAVVVQEQLQN